MGREVPPPMGVAPGRLLWGAGAVLPAFGH